MNGTLKVWVVVVICAGAASVSPAQTFTTLVNFAGGGSAHPDGPLLQATDGNLYGATAGEPGTLGSIFKITPKGTLTIVHNFDLTDGQIPNASLIQATNGDLYGTTSMGGANTWVINSFGGTIFRITRAGVLTSLYSFCAQPNCTDGEFPLAGLVQAANGNLYGTTALGGANGSGTVFEITPSGTFTVLHNFNGTDGSGPRGLVQAADGDLYGATSSGGPDGASSYGTIFKITPSGTFTTLYAFTGTDGEAPNELVQASNGDFYGTTNAGGTNSYGSIFKITPAGKLTTLHNFDMADGSFPNAALIQATNGTLYGTTTAGGEHGQGAIFEITSAGFAILYSFNFTDGSFTNGLVQDTNGNLYGTANTGGSGLGIYGTVFELNVGLAPFLKTLPGYGLAGWPIAILGSDLAGATSVTFNGTPATILYDAPTVIYAKVPTGATSGKVQVVTPTGTLTSNVSFEVAP